jgi:hypothetical protein
VIEHPVRTLRTKRSITAFMFGAQRRTVAG